MLTSYCLQYEITCYSYIKKAEIQRINGLNNQTYETKYHPLRSLLYLCNSITRNRKRVSAYTVRLIKHVFEFGDMVKCGEIPNWIDIGKLPTCFALVTLQSSRYYTIFPINSAFDQLIRGKKQTLRTVTRNHRKQKERKKEKKKKKKKKKNFHTEKKHATHGKNV